MNSSDSDFDVLVLLCTNLQYINVLQKSINRYLIKLDRYSLLNIENQTHRKYLFRLVGIVVTSKVQIILFCPQH